MIQIVPKFACGYSKPFLRGRVNFRKEPFFGQLCEENQQHQATLVAHSTYISFKFFHALFTKKFFSIVFLSGWKMPKKWNQGVLPVHLLEGHARGGGGRGRGGRAQTRQWSIANLQTASCVRRQRTGRCFRESPPRNHHRSWPSLRLLPSSRTSRTRFLEEQPRESRALLDRRVPSDLLVRHTPWRSSALDTRALRPPTKKGNTFEFSRLV